MTKQDEQELRDILEQAFMGNWSSAIEEYKSLNMSPRDFTAIAYSLSSNDLCDLALLGYYAREKDQK